MIAPEDIVARLLQDPIIGQLPHATLSRLLPSIDVKVISAGETLAHLGRPVEDLILLVEGKLSAKSKSGSEINLSDGRIGDEILAGLPIQTLSVTARETSIVLLIPNKSIKAATSTKQLPRETRDHWVAMRDIFSPVSHCAFDARITAHKRHHISCNFALGLMHVALFISG